MIDGDGGVTKSVRARVFVRESARGEEESRRIATEVILHICIDSNRYPYVSTRASVSVRRKREYKKHKRNGYRWRKREERTPVEFVPGRRKET